MSGWIGEARGQRERVAWPTRRRNLKGAPDSEGERVCPGGPGARLGRGGADRRRWGGLTRPAENDLLIIGIDPSPELSPYGVRAERLGGGFFILARVGPAFPDAPQAVGRSYHPPLNQSCD